MTSTPGIDYPIGTTWQPNEPPMEMTLEMLDVRATGAISEPGIYKYDDFLIYNEVPGPPPQTHDDAQTSLLTSLAPAATVAADIDFSRTDAAPGNMRFAWIHGSLSAKANTDVRVQVHRYNEHTYILRQNPAVHWEAPFMYLLIGNKRAVLLDAGATEGPRRFRSVKWWTTFLSVGSKRTA